MSFNIQRGLFKYDITDHYAILGIPLNTEAKAVRKQYLKLAHSLHPDKLRDASDRDRQQANEILSKLVNPAYENLKDKSKTRKEYHIVLEQTGKRLAGEGLPPLESEEAQQLSQASGDIDTAYKRAVSGLASGQYKAIAQALEKIATISELNLVYLMRKEGQGIRKPASSTSTVPKAPPPPQKGQPAKPGSVPQPQPQTSPVDPYLRRAREYIEKGNYAKAILELRDGLKLDPKNSSCHSLMGLAYLKQNQVSMAKVHITKALQYNPQDELGLKGKAALDRLAGKTSGKQTASNSGKGKSGKSNNNKSGSGGMFGLFGGKKK
ncbi:MAG: DnaJ domain-containing protein [Cyanobacteria bacterium SBLK]|nr:DnaJ domain-containing protein [Cyanobacteria bacterium SBLK]